MIASSRGELVAAPLKRLPTALATTDFGCRGHRPLLYIVDFLLYALPLLTCLVHLSLCTYLFRARIAITPPYLYSLARD